MIDWKEMRAAIWESFKIMLTGLSLVAVGILVFVVPVALIAVTGSYWWVLLWLVAIFIWVTTSIYIERQREKRFWNR